MEALHSLLARQLKKHFGAGISPPEGLSSFVEAINLAYREFDEDRALVERSLEFSSRELLAANSEIRALFQVLPDLVLRLDHQGKILTFNVGESSDHSLPIRSLLGERLQDTLVKPAGEKLTEVLQQVILKRTPLSMEYSQQAADTETFYEVRLVPLLENQIVAIIRNITERKRAEVALHESQALYHSLVEQLPNGMFRKDRAGRYEYVNSMFCRIVEMSKDQILGKDSAELVACMQAQRNAVRPVAGVLGTQGEIHHDSIMRTGQQIEVEDEYVGADGLLNYYHTIKSAVFGSGGQTIGSQGVMFDITERKRIDVALHESQALYDSLVEHLPAGVFRKDLEGRFVFVNSWYCRLKGVKADYFLGKTPPEVAVSEQTNQEGNVPEGMKDAEMATRGANHHRQIMQSGKPIEIEEQYRDANGNVQYLHVVKSPVFSTDGIIMGSQGMLFDITESKRAQAELAYERGLLRALLDNAPDHIYFKDTQSRFIKSSKAQAAQFGLKSSDDLVGKTDFDFFSDEHARPAYEDEQAIIRTGQPIIGKIEKETWKDGRGESWVLTTKMPFRNKDGEIVGTFGISKDITAIKQSEAELERIHKQLLETSRLAGMAEVATGVLHNVGNVLNSVNVASGCVADNLRKSKAVNLFKVVALLRANETDLGRFFTRDPKGKQLLDYLAQLTEHIASEHANAQQELTELQKHIDHIKDIVSMQQSFANVSGLTENVSVTDLMEYALSMNQSALARHDVKISKEFDNVPPVTVEKHKVLQILVNLVTNAKQACDAANRDDRRITLRVLSQANCIHITVSDNGVGVPPENLTRIFNHGFTTKKNGHGFGLHSSALAAKEMGGALKVHSDGLGCGTVFTLELPLKQTRINRA